jgi:hypothetical protein
MRNAYKVLVGKLGGKRPLEISRRRWDGIIIMYLKETGQEGVKWIHLAQNRNQWWVLANMVMNLRVP